FATEALQALPVVCQFLRQEFERHETIQACVLSLVDHTHTATAKLLDDAVVRNRLSDERRGLRHLARILGAGLEQVNEAAPVDAARFGKSYRTDYMRTQRRESA